MTTEHDVRKHEEEAEETKEEEEEETSLKLTLKLMVPLESHTPPPLRIGAHGGAALKEVLSTAPNPEVAIREFQATHGIPWPFASRSHAKKLQLHDKNKTNKRMGVAPVLQLLDLLHVRRSTVYQSVLQRFMNELLLRIQELPQPELQQLLEITFPYIEFRELRAIPIAILARQDHTPDVYLRELTENRRILTELPVHVRRKILHVDKQELSIFVEQCTQEYIEEQMNWCLHHQFHHTTKKKRALFETSEDTTKPAWVWVPEDRRRQSHAVQKLSDMIGDSEQLYLSTLEIWKEYIVTASIPGSNSTHSKEYVDYVPFLGAMRSDLANLQRDRTTTLLRTDPIHKFIWFVDRLTKTVVTSRSNMALEMAQLHELLAFIKRVRIGDLPPNKKIKKKMVVGSCIATQDDEEETFEMVLGPPSVNELLQILDKLVKMDTKLIFTDPVPENVPGYRDVIKEPMDLSTMRKKAKKGKYKTLEMFVEDFQLMIQNCMTFNPEQTIYHKEAKRIGKRGRELIDRQAATLRGEPQRIRAKKRKKTGSSEVFSMLSSAGTGNPTTDGDIDRCGMVPEGSCEEALADIALVLCDPLVKHAFSDALAQTLVTSCWQKTRELPTDNVVCRSLVQLLQIGNAASVRRMLRKRDFALYAPQVVTMRLVLPMFLRLMVTFRIGTGNQNLLPVTLAADERKKKQSEELELVQNRSLWGTILSTSTAIRTMTKTLIVKSLADHHIEVGMHLLEHLLVIEGDWLLRDRVLLHAMVDVTLNQLKTLVTSHTEAPQEAESSNKPTVCERLRTSPIWKLVVDGFFIVQVAKKTSAVFERFKSVMFLEEVDDLDDAQQQQPSLRRIRSFACAILHEHTAMLLASVFTASSLSSISKDAEPVFDQDIVEQYLKQTLGALMRCCASVEEFDALWSSHAFRHCRTAYEQILTAFPHVQAKLLEVIVTTSSSTNADESTTETTNEETTAQPKIGEPTKEATSEETTERPIAETTATPTTTSN